MTIGLGRCAMRKKDEYIIKYYFMKLSFFYYLTGSCIKSVLDRDVIA